MNMPKLKPCPFCGGEANIDRYMRPKEEWRIMCTKCSARLGRYAGLSEKEATEAWNRRILADCSDVKRGAADD